MTADEKYRQMTEEPVRPLVMKMAVPTIFSMLVSAFYNMADTYFVGTVGTQATAAVGVVFSIMAIMQAFSFFFGHGSGTFISRKLGEKKVEEAYEMASTGFFSAISVGILIAIIGNLFVHPLGRILGSTPTILPYTIAYLRFILAGAPFIMGSFVMNNYLRYQGNAFYGMIGMVSGAVANIILDPVLIWGLHMGVAGAGVATMCSQMISFLLLIILVNKKGSVPVTLKNVKPSIAIYMEIIKGGLPSLCRQGLASLAAICLNHQAGLYGDAAIAAMSIVTRLAMFAFSAVIGMGQGFQPVCGFNYGARKCKRVREAFSFATRATTLFLIVAAIAGYIFAEPLIRVFRRDDLQVIQIGTTALRYQCFALPLMGLITMGSMMAQTMGLAVRATLLSMGRQFLFFLPALFLLTPVLHLTGIQLTQPIADVFTFLLTIPVVVSIMNHNLRENDEKSANNP